MPRLVDVRERDVRLTDAVLGLAAHGGVAAVTLRAVAQRAGFTLAEVRYARPSRERLLHLAVARASERRARRRRDVHVRNVDPIVRLVGGWLPASDADVELERGWLALRWSVAHLAPATAALLAADDAALRQLCTRATSSTSAALLLAATAEGLDAAVVRGALDLGSARVLLTHAARASMATGPASAG